MKYLVMPIDIYDDDIYYTDSLTDAKRVANEFAVESIEDGDYSLRLNYITIYKLEHQMEYDASTKSHILKKEERND